MAEFTVDELMALGQLAGYSKAETAQMILDSCFKNKPPEQENTDAAPLPERRSL